MAIGGRVGVRAIPGLVALAIGLGPTSARGDDAMGRSVWTVSTGAGALQGWAGSLCVQSPEGSPGALCDPSRSIGWTAFALDLAVPFTVARSPDGRRAFEVGPQALVLVYTGDGLFRDEPVSRALALQFGGGLVAGLRFRPAPPSAPGGRAVFEHGFRLGSLFGPGFNGVVHHLGAEAWAAWALPQRWVPPPATGLPAAPPATNRTAVVLGPYLRGWFRHVPFREGASSAVEIGLRVELRRQHAVPQPPG